MRKRIYVDMDDVLCDYFKAASLAILKNPNQPYPQSKWSFYLDLEEIPGAIEGFRKLQDKYDVWILTRPSFYNINSFSEKAQWVLNHLGFEIVQKTIMCGDKSLLKGDYLIDDMTNAGQLDFEGEFIEFGSNKFPDWTTVTEYLMNKE
jgi:5'(3')-deoxyribonucleotidase